MGYCKNYEQGNGVSVCVASTYDGEIVFDLVGVAGSRRLSRDFRAYQNLTLDEAKKLRKALGKAIKTVEESA